MSGKQAALVAVLSAILAACNAGAEPTPSDPVGLATPPPTPSLAGVSPTPTPFVATPTPPATSTPKPTPKPVPPKPVPPKPSGVKFDEDVHCLNGRPVGYCNRARLTQTVTWRAPRTKGVEIRVYGVTECLSRPSHPKPDTSGPCLVEHTGLPESVRTLLATAPASDGKVSWSWKDWVCECGCASPLYDHDGPAYSSIVLAAYNASGHSIFAIAEPGGWWEPGPGDMIC